MLTEIVAEIEGATAFAGVPNAFHWQVAGGKFNFVAAIAPDERHLYQINTRDFFDAELCRETLVFALENEPTILAKQRSLTVLKGFTPKNFEFETVVALAPRIHPVHKADRPRLHEVTYAVFPAFECELAGDEDDEDLKYIYNKMLKPSELNRDPNPIVRMKFKIQLSGVRSEGSGRILFPLRTLLETVDKIEGSPDSFIELENFKHVVATIVWNDRFKLSMDGKSTSFSSDDLKSWLLRFVIKGTADVTKV